MINTYNQLKEIAKLYTGEKDLNKLAVEYQKTQDTLALSYFFCKNFGLLVSQTEKFFGLTDDDKASFVLEEIHEALMQYDPSKAKVTTFVVRFIYTRLRSETQNLQLKKRAGELNTASLEGEILSNDKGDMQSTGFERFLTYKEEEYSKFEVLASLVEIDELTDNEYKYCELLIKEDHIKDSDIAQKLNITSAAVHYIKKSLRKKLGGNDFLFSL